MNTQQFIQTGQMIELCCGYRKYPNLVRTQVEIISGTNYLVRILFEK